MGASSATAGAKSAEDFFSALLAPGVKEIHQMGRKENASELLRRLKASGAEDMSLTNEEKEECFETLRVSIDESKDEDGWGLLHFMAYYEGDDFVESVRRLLALGIDPDIPDKSGNRPTHMCVDYVLPRCAEAFALCRPDLTACRQDSPAGPSSTLVDEAKHFCKKYEKEPDKQAPYATIRNIFENAARDGFPSLAELSCDAQWFAVKNLCRRRAVKVKEVLGRYEGRNTVEWAEYHGQDELAREIRYLFKLPRKRKREDDNDDEERVRKIARTVFVLRDSDVISSRSSAHCQEVTAGGGAWKEPALVSAMNSLYDGIRTRATAAGLEPQAIADLSEVLKKLPPVSGSKKGGSEPRQ